MLYKRMQVYKIYSFKETYLVKQNKIIWLNYFVHMERVLFVILIKGLVYSHLNKKFN